MGDYRLSRRYEERNAALGPKEAVEVFRGQCRAFLEATTGLKLTPGPLNMVARQAWTRALIALDATDTYEGDTDTAQYREWLRVHVPDWDPENPVTVPPDDVTKADSA